MRPILVAIITLAMFATIIAISLNSTATGWQLDNTESRLNFISTKAKDVAEVHRFTELNGSVTEAGIVTLAVKLTSVETSIDIRNQRMQHMLFEVAKFPEAIVTGQLDMAPIQALHTGESLNLNQEFLLDLHGNQGTIAAELSVTRLTSNRVQVASVQPIVIRATDFKLGAGIEMLREAAGLPGISLAVPVSALLVFKL